MRIRLYQDSDIIQLNLGVMDIKLSIIIIGSFIYLYIRLKILNTKTNKVICMHYNNLLQNLHLL